jgi:hypothetical protein
MIVIADALAFDRVMTRLIAEYFEVHAAIKFARTNYLPPTAIPASEALYRSIMELSTLFERKDATDDNTADPTGETGGGFCGDLPGARDHEIDGRANAAEQLE